MTSGPHELSLRKNYVAPVFALLEPVLSFQVDAAHIGLALDVHYTCISTWPILKSSLTPPEA